MPDLFNRFSNKALLSAFVLLGIYCLWIGLFVGFRGDHVFLIALCLSTWFFNMHSRRFITAFFIFIVYWIAYDAMRVLPNYMVNPVHIEEPYEIEKSIFGFMHYGTVITPNEFFKIHNNPVADFFAGVFYINWVPVPLAFAFYLLRRDKIYFLRFAYAFVLTNFLGFIVYYLYPAAPPWYVDIYGFDFNLDTPSNPAGLVRFDEMFGITLFQSIYSKNANIFAAIPSLHAAYPVVVLYYGLKRNMGLVNILFLIFLLGIWFTAVYTFHHYIIDLLIGAACALMALFIFEYLFAKPKINNQFLKLAGRI